MVFRGFIDTQDKEASNSVFTMAHLSYTSTEPRLREAGLPIKARGGILGSIVVLRDAGLVPEPALPVDGLGGSFLCAESNAARR